MAWNGNVPKRTGVPALRNLASKVCQLLALFTPIIKVYLDPSRHIYVDDLNAACQAFVDNVLHPCDFE